MKSSLKEDTDFERAHNEKDVITLRTLLKNVNFDYKKTEEPIKTLWQAEKDLINMRQYKMDLTDYYNKFKSLSKVVGELQHSDHGSPYVDIICRETKADPTSLNGNEKLELTKKGEERMKAMQLIQNSDRDKCGSLIEDFDRAFLSGNNNYPQTPLEAYNLLKG